MKDHKLHELLIIAYKSSFFKRRSKDQQIYLLQSFFQCILSNLNIMKTNSSTSIKFGPLSLNESPVENSIIGQLPYPTESVDLIDKINSLNDDVIRLNNELNYYKKSALLQDKSSVTNSKQSIRQTKHVSIEQESRMSSLANENTKLKQEIAEQREIIRKISEELRSQKRQVKFDEKGMMNEYQRLQLQHDQLRYQNLIYLKDIKELQFQLAQQQLQLKRNAEIIEIQKRELKLRNSYSEEDLKYKNMELEYKVADMAQEINEYLKEIDSLNTQIQKMRKQNVIDRQSRLRRNHYQLSPNESSKSRFRDSSMSRLNELEMMDNQRLNLKLAEKNKDYQLLYIKYQGLQHNYNELEENQRDMQRQRKLLEQKISSFEIHTQGDEVVGQLENKLVLMSTQLMRLGHLSRTKVQQSNELSMKLKEFILKNQHLEKDLIEKDKIILNYKEELRLMEMRLNEQAQDEEKAREQKELKNKTSKLVKQVQRITLLYKQKLQALKQSDIKSAILEQKNIRLTKENEDLQKELKNYVQNVDKNKQKATKMLNQQAEINYYKQTNANLKEQIKRIQTRMYEVRSDAENIQRQRDEYRSMNITLQENYVSLQEDLRRMNLKIDEKQVQNREAMHRAEQKLIMKNNEIKRLQQKIKDIEKENQLMSRYRSQLPKYQELIKEIQRLEGIQISLKLQISNYEEKVALIAQENERLISIADSHHQDTATIQRFKQDTQQKDKKIRELSKEVQSVTFRQKKYREENDNLRMKLRQNVLNQRQSQSLQFKNRQLSDELQTLSVQLSLKDEEIRTINERFNREYLEKQMLVRKNEELSSKANITSSLNIDTTTKQYYENQLRKYLQQSKRDGMRIKELMQQTEQQQQIYNTFSSQIMRLNQVISEYTERISLYKKQIDFLQHKVKTCEQTLLQRRTFNQLGSEKSIVESEIKTKIQIYEGRIRQYQTEVQMYKQRYNTLKESSSAQQSKISSLFIEKSQLEHRVNDLQYQLSIKSESLRTVQDSFKLTILEIKNSNERLQQSMRQIQNHYIHKLQLKEQQYDILRCEKARCDQSIHELQKKLSNMEIEYGSEMNEKNRYISTLNNNHNQTKQEVEEIRKIKSQYEIKIALFTQEIQRINYVKDKQQEQIKAMSRQLKQEEMKFVQSMKDSSYHNQTLQILSQQIERLNSVLLKNVETIKEGHKKTYALQVQNNTLKQQFNQLQLKKEEMEMRYGQERDMLTSRCQKAEENIRENKYQLQQKDRDLQRMTDRLRTVKERQRVDVNSQMQHLLEEMRLLREGNQNLQHKLGLITRQYEHSVSQLEYYKNLKANADQDEKMRIIANYESTIKNMREENTKFFNEKMKFQNQFEKTFQRANEIQERYNISEEKARTYEEKSRRLDQRLKVLEERIRQSNDGTKGILQQKSIIEQKLITAMQQVGRLQFLIKSKQSEINQLNIEIKQKNNLYNSQEKLADKKGIFIIKEVNEFDERSRSASGNNPQPQNRISGNQIMLDLQHRYELLESVNKKLSSENQSLRKKGVQYEFKMNKLKEQFDLINRLIHEYRQENDKLKENNKLMNLQLHQKSHHISAHSHLSPQHNSVNTSSYIEKSSFSHKSNIQAKNEKEKETSFSAIKNKLLQEIDRLSRVNVSLQTEVHDLRLNTTENVALRKRMEQNMATIIQSLRLRVREGEMRMLPPLKGPL